jgi:hypothetical protein
MVGVAASFDARELNKKPIPCHPQERHRGVGDMSLQETGTDKESRRLTAVWLLRDG